MYNQEADCKLLKIRQLSLCSFSIQILCTLFVHIFFLSRANLADLDVMHHIVFDIIRDWGSRPVLFSCQRISVRLISLSDKNQQT